MIWERADKTAQEWQEQLNLDELPDAEMVEMLNAAAGMETSPFTDDELLARGLVVEMTPNELAAEVERLYVEQSLGKVLAALRAERHKTLQEVGDALGITRSRVAHLERGENAKLDTIARFAAALGFEATLVFRATEPEEVRFELPLSIPESA